MRVALLLVCTTLFSFTPTEVFSKNEMIKIETTEVLTVAEVFDLIMKQTEYTFIYEKGIFKNTPKIEVKKGVISANTLLEKSFSHNKISFKLTKENTLIFTKKERLQQIVMGKTTDSKSGEILAGVTVLIKGTFKGVTSNFNGIYKIKATKGAILQFSYIGYNKKEIVVGNQKIINVALEESAESLKTVFITTALGIKKEEKKVGYAVSTIKSGEIIAVSNPNVMTALYGKSAGLMIKSSSSSPIGGVRVVIRGNNSITGNNQALFIVDGIPIEHENTSSGKWSSNKGNPINDINPDDIESVTVLKGANAAALYGSRASGGAILITTKSGNGKQRGIGVTINSSVTTDNVAYLPDYQNIYGAGYTPTWKLNAAGEKTYSGTYYSFGPKMEGQQVRWWDGEMRSYSPQPNNYKDIFTTGITRRNSISLSKNYKDKINFRLGYTNMDYKGTFPGTKQKRNSLSLNTNIHLSDKFTVGLVANHYDIKTTNRPYNLSGLAAYEYSRSSKFNLVKDYITEDGYMKYNAGGTSIRLLRNKLWANREDLRTDELNRTVTNFSFKYTPFKGFTALLRSGGDFTTTNYANKYRSEEKVNSGGYSVAKGIRKTRHSQLTINYKKSISEALDISLLAGVSSTKKEYDYSSLWTRGGLIIPNWFSIGNSRWQTKGKGHTTGMMETGIFGAINLNYKDFLFSEITGRNDRTSTLHPDNNSFFYPSISTSFVYSELLKDTNWLNFGKLRAAYSHTAKGASMYQANKVYSYGSYNGATTNSYSSTVPPVNLMPEDQFSLELGSEMKLFHNRLGINVTYYHNINKNLIVNLGVAGSSGSTAATVNAGRMDNKGIELELEGLILKTHDFSWNANLNIAKNNNEIIELAKGIESFTPRAGAIGSAIINQARIGAPLGEWAAYVPKKDKDGNLIVKSHGIFYERDDTKRVKVGNSTPDFFGGFNNRFTYKNISLSMNIDFSVGGDVFSFTNYYGTGTGKLKSSLKYRDEKSGGLPYYVSGGKRIQLASHSTSSPNGETVHHDGVILPGYRNGEKNDKIIPALYYYAYTYMWNSGLHEKGLFDNTYVKMREIRLSYKFNKTLIDNIGIQDMSLNLIGRNLFYLFKNMPNVDPESSVGTATGENSAFENGGMPGTRSIGMSLQLKF